MALSKSGLAVELSKLEVFQSPKPSLEQYPTDSEVAAEVLWSASMMGEIEGRTIADLGCGTGVLGIGALLLGAEKVFFIDTDTAALKVLSNNLRSLGIKKGFEIIDCDIKSFKKKVDVVIQNPPFGTREKHADRAFLETATSVADIVYSLHKTATAKFVNSFASDNGFEITHRFDFDFPMKQTLSHHKKKVHRIKVACFRLGRV